MRKGSTPVRTQMPAAPVHRGGSKSSITVHPTMPMKVTVPKKSTFDK